MCCGINGEIPLKSAELNSSTNLPRRLINCEQHPWATTRRVVQRVGLTENVNDVGCRVHRQHTRTLADSLPGQREPFGRSLGRGMERGRTVEDQEVGELW